MMMRRLRTLIPPAAVAAAGAAFLIAGPAEAGKSKTVTIGSNFYAPAKLTVKAGDKVRFAWEGGSIIPHDVNVKKGPVKFHSPIQAAGTYTRKLKKPGTYRLQCSVHPEMHMTLKVKKR
jgi:plastocyanin